MCKAADHNLEIKRLLTEIGKQIANDPNLPLGSHPILQMSSQAIILIIGQAPGIQAQKTGIPWNDKSGNRLRSWLGISKDIFYDENKIAIMPMGFCYPGSDKFGGDKPPDIKHANLWHKSLIALMPNIKLTLLVGSYAHHYYLKEKVKSSMTETVFSWREYLPEFIVLPHPSWHNNAWIKRHKWFETDLVPELQKCIKKLLN